jgi:hypothetical protein
MFETNYQAKELKMIIGCNLVGVLNFIRSLSSVEEEQPGEAKHYPDHLVCREVLPVENQANKYKKDRNGCVGKKGSCTYVPTGTVHFDEAELDAEDTYAKQYTCPVEGFHVRQDAIVLSGKKIKSNTGGGCHEICDNERHEHIRVARSGF